METVARRSDSETASLHLLVSGASGFIGSALVPFLMTGGHRVTRLVRRASQPARQHASWDPKAGSVDLSGLSNLDAVVHLAGENIVGRWTAAKKARIRDSRIRGTRVLCEALASLAQPPRTLVCASGVGYYGDRGDEALTEDSGSGSGFLAEVCREWEAAAEPARQRGIRVVHLRFGVVLGPAGGPLKLMLPPFQLGLGGPLGSGRQYFSWVAIDDVLGAIRWALTQEQLQGPVNVVSPNPVTNLEFTKTLARVLRRPAVLPAPAPMLRMILGEMADEALLSSARVVPSRLLAQGYVFREPELEPALRHLLGRRQP